MQSGVHLICIGCFYIHVLVKSFFKYFFNINSTLILENQGIITVDTQ
jgi:hypothetical protein